MLTQGYRCACMALRRSCIWALLLATTCGMSVCVPGVSAQTPIFRAADAALVFNGESFEGKFGNRNMTVGDINFDGINDYMVAARWADLNGIDSGAIYLYSGADESLIQRLDGERAFDEFGHRCDAMGDLNNDGAGDFVVSVYRNDEAGIDAGKIYVYSGADRQLLYVLYGEGAGDQLGHATEVLEDIDGDGCKDLLLGAYLNDSGGTDAGAVYLVSGRTGENIEFWTGEHAGDWFGYRIERGGDINRDGSADILVGAMMNDDAGLDAGKGYAISGDNGQIMRTWVGEGPGQKFAERVSPAGDVNDDGYGDVLIASLEHAGVGADSGKVYLYSGKTGALLNSYLGETAGALFGDRIHALGDVNGDSIGDFIISAPDDSSGGVTERGKVYIIPGSRDPLIRATPLYTLQGASQFDHFGKTVFEIGDVNGDLRSDFMVGVQYDNAAGNDAGRVYVYNGSTGRALYIVDGEARYDNFGYSANNGGDLNQDGLPDFCIGAVSAGESTGFETGRSYVFLSSQFYVGANPLIPGESGSVYVTGAKAGEQIDLFVSFAGVGIGPVINGTNGLRLDILAPVFMAGSVVANQSGEAVSSGLVPVAVRQFTAGYFQGIIRRGNNGVSSVKSNVYKSPVQPN